MSSLSLELNSVDTAEPIDGSMTRRERKAAQAAKVRSMTLRSSKGDSDDRFIPSDTSSSASSLIHHASNNENSCDNANVSDVKQASFNNKPRHYEMSGHYHTVESKCDDDLPDYYQLSDYPDPQYCEWCRCNTTFPCQNCVSYIPRPGDSKEYYRRTMPNRTIPGLKNLLHLWLHVNTLLDRGEYKSIPLSRFKKKEDLLNLVTKMAFELMEWYTPVFQNQDLNEEHEVGNCVNVTECLLTLVTTCAVAHAAAMNLYLLSATEG